MAFKMTGFSGFTNSPLAQKKPYKWGEDYTDNKGQKWSWDSFTKTHNKVDIDLTGVPVDDWNKEIKRQDPNFKFPKGEEPK
jgi:glucose dehydrogenase